MYMSRYMLEIPLFLPSDVNSVLQRFEKTVCLLRNTLAGRSVGFGHHNETIKSLNTYRNKGLEEIKVACVSVQQLPENENIQEVCCSGDRTSL